MSEGNEKQDSRPVLDYAFDGTTLSSLEGQTEENLKDAVEHQIERSVENLRNNGSEESVRSFYNALGAFTQIYQGIESPADVDKFTEQMESGMQKLLRSLTQGYGPDLAERQKQIGKRLDDFTLAVNRSSKTEKDQ